MEPDFTNNVPSGHDDEQTVRRRALVKVAAGVLVGASIVILASYFPLTRGGHDQNTTNATTAARKQTPNAQASNVKVAGGFAMALVSDPTADGQAAAGNTTIFKVNQDGSMTQIANGSSFGPLDLLELGIPLLTQAKLTGNDIGQLRRNLAGACGYDGGTTPGYGGFDGSFNPGDWQFDSGTLGDLEQVLTTSISTKDSGQSPDQNIICVNATRDRSNATTDTTTYINTFTIPVEFITSAGTLTTHTLTVATGPHYYRSYTLDGQTIGQ